MEARRRSWRQHGKPLRACMSRASVCELSLFRSQGVECAELVFHPPTPPITQSAKIFEDSFFSWYALLHSPSPTLVWIQATIVRCLARDLKAQRNAAHLVFHYHLRYRVNRATITPLCRSAQVAQARPKPWRCTWRVLPRRMPSCITNLLLCSIALESWRMR